MYRFYFVSFVSSSIEVQYGHLVASMAISVLQ